jgi:hypothetical protein
MSWNKPWSEYQQIVVETYAAIKVGGVARIRDAFIGFQRHLYQTDDTTTRNLSRAELGGRSYWPRARIVDSNIWRFDGASPFPAACRGHEPVIGIWLWLGFLEESGSGVIE